MLSSAHFASHCYDDGCFNNEDVKLDLQHVEQKGLRLAGGPVDREKGVCLSEEAADDALAAEWGLTALSCASNVFSSSSSSDNIDVLPNEVLVLILSYLDAHQLLSVSSTCHRWRALAHGTTALCLPPSVRSRGADSYLHASSHLRRGDPVEAGGRARLSLPGSRPRAAQALRASSRPYGATSPRPFLRAECPIDGGDSAVPKEVDHERATGLSRWKSVWLAQRKTRCVAREVHFRHACGLGP